MLSLKLNIREACEKQLLIANVLVFGVICCFIFSPLRLTFDSVRLFAMALPASIGEGYGVDQFPPLYPHLLSWLIRHGWCNSLTLLGINIVSLGAALLVLYGITKVNGCDPTESMIVLLVVQLCWCIAKHVLIPQTDVLLLPFFLGTILSLMIFQREDKVGKKALCLFLALLLSVVSVLIRTAALPLFAVIAVALTGVTPSSARNLLKTKTFWWVCLSLLAIFAVGVALAIKFTRFDSEGGYFQEFKSYVAGSGIAAFGIVGLNHLREIMELGMNVSGPKIPHFAASVGTVGGPVLFFLALWKCWRWLNWYLLLALLGYGLEIFMWPFSDPRFLLPVFPIGAILVVHFLRESSRKSKGAKCFAWSYFMVFVCLGAASWGWFARQWGFRQDFHRHTPAPTYARDYKNAFQKEIKDIPESERTIIVFILKKFDPAHTLAETEDLPLSDFKKFKAEWRKR